MNMVSVISAQCGAQAGGVGCFLGQCCSKYGYCGTGDLYCGAGCQKWNCTGGEFPSSPVVPEPRVANFITEDVFDEIFPMRNSSFYTYDSFIAAVNAFQGFGTTGGAIQQRREVAALFAHITQETQGLHYINELSPGDTYCVPSFKETYPCFPGQSYHGRGPLQLSW